MPWGCPLHLPLQELSPERGNREGAIPSRGLDMWEAPSAASALSVPFSGEPGAWGLGRGEAEGAGRAASRGRRRGYLGEARVREGMRSGRGRQRGARGREGGAGRGSGGDNAVREGEGRLPRRAGGGWRAAGGREGGGVELWGGGAWARAAPALAPLPGTGPRQLLAGAASRHPSPAGASRSLLLAPCASPAPRPAAEEAPLRGRTPGSPGKSDER